MAKEEMLEFDGVVTEVLPDGNFRVKLDNEHEILAYTAGKMRKFRIRTGVGDRVIVEMSPYDLSRGRISFRHKSAQPVSAATGQRQFRDLPDGVTVRLKAETGRLRHREEAVLRLRQTGEDLLAQLHRQIVM